jgi:PTS system nitrogen regulatory IIA component
MKISEVMDTDLIIAELRSRSKRGVLEELAGVLAERWGHADRDEVFRVLLEREKLGSTALCEGVAIPHGRIKGLDHLFVSFGRSKEGVDFGSTDEKPTHLFFLLLAPAGHPEGHLAALSGVSRLVGDPGFRKRLLGAGTKNELHRIILEQDARSWDSSGPSPAGTEERERSAPLSVFGGQSRVVRKER